MQPNDVEYVHRVGPFHWLFTHDVDQRLAPLKLHLRYNPRDRTFAGHEARPPSPIPGWSDLLALSDAEVAVLRTLLPPAELAYCLRSSLVAEKEIGIPR